MTSVDMTAIGQLREYLASEPGQEQYLSWIKNPMTQMMLSAGRELAQPRAPIVVDGVNASLELGRSVGGHALLAFFQAPVSVAEDRMKQMAGLRPTYGAERILMEGQQ